MVSLALADVVTTVASALVGPSAAALRVISTGAQVIGTLHGSQHMVLAGTAGQAVAKFLDAAAGGAGATVTDSAATAAGQRSNAPNQEDLTSAPAPQLAETTDPAGQTRPEVPEGEFHPGLQNHFFDPLNDPDHLLQVLITEINGQDVEMANEWDPEELEQMLTDIENQILNARRFLVGGTDRIPIKVKQKNHHLIEGVFAPV